jgi:hypothetical protein
MTNDHKTKFGTILSESRLPKLRKTGNRQTSSRTEATEVAFGRDPDYGLVGLAKLPIEDGRTPSASSCECAYRAYNQRAQI